MDFLSKGVFTTFDAPGAFLTYVFGTNSEGDLVGTHFDVDPAHSAAFVLSKGQFTTLLYGTRQNEAHGINARGDVVGWFFGFFQGTHGFLLSQGTFSAIDVPSANFTNALGINARGDIVGVYGDAAGTHGFLLSGGAYSTIDPPGSIYTQANGINTRGDIVGNYSNATGGHAFLLSN